MKERYCSPEINVVNFIGDGQDCLSASISSVKNDYDVKDKAWVGF